MRGQRQPFRSMHHSSTENASWQLHITQHAAQQQPLRPTFSCQQPQTTQFASQSGQIMSFQQFPTQTFMWCPAQLGPSNSNRSRGAAASAGISSAYHIKQMYIRDSPSNRTAASVRRYFRAERPQNPEERKDARIDQLLNHRWREYTKYGNTFHHTPDKNWLEFSLATYNVLAQNLLEGNSYLYRHCSDEFLAWEYRRRNLLTELKRLNADILCLQEVVEEHFKKYFEPKLQKFGYDGVYKKKTDPHAMDGCAIFYKRSKFLCLGVYPVEYYDRNVPVLDRHNVGLVLHLRCRKLSNRWDKRHSELSDDKQRHHADICVASTHLLFNPKRGDVKLAQIMKLFTTIGEVARKVSADEFGTYCPVLLCGDMNSNPYSDIYRFIRNGLLSCDETVVPQMCARPDDLGYSRGRTLSRDFLSVNAGISDDCQRMSNQMQENCRIKKDSKNVTVNLGDEPSHNKLSLSNVQESSDINATAQKGVSSSLTQGSGVISHPFLFRSVYAHDARKKMFDANEEMISAQELRDTSESTSCHGSTNETCDYIFYTPYNRAREDRCMKNSVAAVEANHSAPSVNVEENIQSQGLVTATVTPGADDEASESLKTCQPSYSSDVIVIDDDSNSSCVSDQQSEANCGASPNRLTEQLRLLHRLRLPTVKDMKYIGGLPNRIASSDHVPLLAVFAIRQQPDS